MTKLKTNYHSHIKLCAHAEGMPIDYIKKAVELGYDELGISDHGPLGFSHQMTLDEFYNVYLPSFNEEKNDYEKKIKVYKGLEVEYVKDKMPLYKELLKKLDYLIMGQHIVIKDNVHYMTYYLEDKELQELYKDQVIDGMKTGLFKIFAHPDLFLYKLQEWNEFTEKLTREIVEASIKYNVLLEVNANGMRRKKIINQDGMEVYIYPRIEFWKVVSEYKEAKVIIGEDNHKISYVGDEYVDMAYKFAEDLNLNIVYKLF